MKTYFLFDLLRKIKKMLNESVSFKKGKKYITVNLDDIELFYTLGNKTKNDENNKKREAMIEIILLDKIPTEWYINSSKWKNLNEEVWMYVDTIYALENWDDFGSSYSFSCQAKGGRNFNFDFMLEINMKKIKVEFKYHAKTIADTPQFVSPTKPSQYLDSSYEEYYYDVYLIPVLEKYNLTIPNRGEYLKKIHSNDPRCVKELKDKYHKGMKNHKMYTGEQHDIDFYQDMNKISEESITSFVKLYHVKKEILTEYLLDTQEDKFYMLYKDGNMYLDKEWNLDNYKITTIEKDKNRYLAKTLGGKELKLLLRWKNCKGVAYPAFQIS